MSQYRIRQDLYLLQSLDTNNNLVECVYEDFAKRVFKIKHGYVISIYADLHVHSIGKLGKDNECIREWFMEHAIKKRALQALDDLGITTNGVNNAC